MKFFTLIRPDASTRHAEAMGGGVLASTFLNTTTSREVRGLGDSEDRRAYRDYSDFVTGPDRDGWPQPGTYKVGQREGADGPWNSRAGKAQLVKSVNPLTGQTDVGYFTVGAGYSSSSLLSLQVLEGP